jgi:hypothetical protein
MKRATFTRVSAKSIHFPNQSKSVATSAPSMQVIVLIPACNDTDAIRTQNS